MWMMMKVSTRNTNRKDCLAGVGELTISIIPETKFYPAIIVINSEKSLDSSA